ncbi:MAG: oligosaccharide repeat unit polymerase [Bacteriovoracaceae bacterium]|jgi:oligosaccharide repeat unit polymerase|nr:oligosaccharide repeat unit polymerase [Bacteriovoracaceae bacterium]
MIWHLLIFLSCSLLLIILSARIYNSFFNTLSLILVWWLGWSFISVLDLGSVAFPNTNVEFLALLFGASMVVGSFCFQSKGASSTSISVENGNASRLLNLIGYTLVVPVILVSLFLLYKTIVIFMNEGVDLMHIRIRFFQIGKNGNLWFSSKIFSALYFILSGVCFHFLLISSMAQLVLLKKKLPMVLLILLVVIETAFKLSRGPLYSLGVCGLYLVFCFPEFLKLTKKHVVRIALGGALSVPAFYLISLARNNSFFRAVFNYHTVGFTLFSKMMENDNFFITNDPSFGRMTLGGLDYLYTIFLRGLGEKMFSSPTHLNLFYQSYKIVTGDKLPTHHWFYTHNSFYTMISSPYWDFGDIGVVFIGLLIGYYVRKFEISFRDKKDLISLVWLLFIFYNCIMGIFGATFETPGFWVVLSILVMVTKYSRVNDSQLKGTQQII